MEVWLRSEIAATQPVRDARTVCLIDSPISILFPSSLDLNIFSKPWKVSVDVASIASATSVSKWAWERKTLTKTLSPALWAGNLMLGFQGGA